MPAARATESMSAQTEPILSILLTSIVSCILQEFRLEPPSDQPAIEPEMGIVMKPKYDLRLLVTRHENR